MLRQTGLNSREVVTLGSKSYILTAKWPRGPESWRASSGCVEEAGKVAMICWLESWRAEEEEEE